MAKPRKKEPTLAELLAQYGRNIASDAPVVGRRIVEGVRSLPEAAAAGNRAMLGATQRISGMLPPVLQMPSIRGDYRPSIDAVTGLARDIATGGNRLVTGTSQRGLDAMGAPRGAGYDLPATELSRMAQDVAVSGAQALPKYMYEHPLDSAYTAAMMMAPTPGRVVRGVTALGKAVRGRRAAPLAAAAEDVAAAPSLAAKYDVAAPPLVGPRLAARAAPQGLIAYHGSPHTFDRFDMSKIGTGEGAQAYGHGLYFAENEGVAQGYRDALTKNAMNSTEFREIGLSPNDRAHAMSFARTTSHLFPEVAARDFANYSGKEITPDLIEAFRKTMNVPKGSMYQVRIDADPADFLDYNAPLSVQPRAMQALRELDLSPIREGNRTRVLLERALQGAEQPDYLAKGQTLASGLNTLFGDNTRPTSDFLNKRGLKGVRYLDQGSRDTGGGSRNFVVFDDALVDILKRYAVGGAVSGRSH